MLRQAQQPRIDLLGQEDAAGQPIYSVTQFEQDMESFKPRIFDTYILPAFMMYYAWASKGMRKAARRMLFTSGLYMAYRNYSEYKKIGAQLQQALSLVKGQANV